jgi:hypothetical protein
MRTLVVALIAGCGTAAAPRTASVVHDDAPAAAERWIFRQLRVGKLPIATRTIFELVIEGDRASLIETDQREHRALSLAEADRGAHWKIVGQRTYRGTASNAPGALDLALALALASEGVQPLQLHCTPRSIDAAAPGALRVPSPNRPADYACGDHGVWDPPAMTPIHAIVCDAGTGASDDDDDDRLVFARPPGLEYAAVHDDCVLQGGGLRIIR